MNEFNTEYNTFGADHLQIAFGLYSSYQNEPIKGIEWYGMILTRGVEKDAEVTIQFIEVHLCTESDWSRFYEPVKNNAKQINQLMQGSNMFCLDEKDTDGNPINQ